MSQQKETSAGVTFAEVKGYLVLLLVACVLCTGFGYYMGYRHFYTPPPFELVQEGVITRVLDGDTAEVKAGGHTFTVRLMGYQAPETGQCFSQEATAKLQALVGKKVKVEFLPVTQPAVKYDMYGQRALVYIYTPAGENFNLTMIRDGFGHEYTVAGAYKYREEFQDAHCTARASKRGMWSKESCGQESIKGRKRACLR